jgi:hypothetical protein
MFNPNPTFLLVQKLKSAHFALCKAFTLGVKADIEKNFSICPKLVINAEHYGLSIGPKAEKRIPSNLGGQFATPRGQCSSIY